MFGALGDARYERHRNQGDKNRQGTHSPSPSLGSELRRRSGLPHVPPQTQCEHRAVIRYRLMQVQCRCETIAPPILAMALGIAKRPEECITRLLGHVTHL
jgi:hypothetical protein